MATSAERKGLNQARFADANDRIDRAARDLVGADDPDVVPFLCECPRTDCMQVILVTLAEYERVRSSEMHNLTAPGHEDESVERVVARTERYVVTEKGGDAAAAFAAEREPR